MKKALNRTGSAASACEPQLFGDILSGMFQSDSPFARAYGRQKYATSYPTTETCVDLKLISRTPGRMDIGQYKSGMLTRDGEEHWLFVENDRERPATVWQRNPHVYEGRYINVIRKPDGTLYPTFNRPSYTPSFSFRHFCLAAAEELLQVAGKAKRKKTDRNFQSSAVAEWLLKGSK